MNNTNTNTGGPAFPIWEASDRGYPEMLDAGMTLRDYFAAKAMLPLMERSGGYWRDDKLKEYAVIAYAMADAMLKAREA